jgi:hypothetical protein
MTTDASVAAAGADAVDQVIETMDDDAHRNQITHAGRPTIAKHVLSWHGRQRVEMPYALVKQWSKDELIASHERLHGDMQRAAR